MRRLWILAVLTLALAGCGSDGGDSVEIASGTLTGKVGGMSWTLASAQTDASLSDDQGIWVDLYAEAVASCGSFGTGNSLILTVPRTTGTHALSLNLNGTFVIADTSDNLIATEGAIRVDEITDTLVRGGLTMTFDADNSVSGVFEATVCAD